MDSAVVEFVNENEVRAAVLAVFDELRVVLAALFPDAAIEHVGSTSIAGTITKGDLDICVLVEQADFNQADQILARHFARNVGSDLPDALSSFVDASRRVPVGVQLVVRGSRADFFVQWRELLRGSRELRDAYNELKSRWHGRSHDDYRVAKSDFIERVLATGHPGDAGWRRTDMTPAPAVLRSDRLLLREWTEPDREALAEMSRDPAVMEFLYPGPLSREDSDAAMDRILGHFRLRGFGFWVVEIPSVTSFAGAVGLAVPRFEASFTPCVEVGWRLARSYWGRGYATEAAAVAMSHGFARLGLDEIVAMTVPANVRSQRVMEKLGMNRDPRDDFDHPMVPAGHPLRRHVLYRKRGLS